MCRSSRPDGHRTRRVARIREPVSIKILAQMLRITGTSNGTPPQPPRGLFRILMAHQRCGGSGSCPLVRSRNSTQDFFILPVDAILKGWQLWLFEAARAAAIG
jgi:hypothetical protein